MNMVTKLNLAVASGALLAVGLLSPGKAAAAQNWQAHAGAGFGDGRLITMKFYPSTISVDEGDSITWTVSGDAHTIAFLSGAAAPDPFSAQAQQPAGGTSYDGTGFVNSGIVGPGKTYTLAFSKAGTYKYNCLIHPGMSAQVVVQPAGTPYPHQQTFYNHEYSLDRAHDIATGAPLLTSILPPPPTENSDGTKTYSVSAGNGNGTESVMRFSHRLLTVHEGDTVTWTNRDPMMPHTVTFPGSDGVFTESFAPAGGSTYDGSVFTSAGVLMGGQTYSLKFTKVGNYSYECLLHDQIGMKATVMVLPK